MDCSRLQKRKSRIVDGSKMNTVRINMERIKEAREDGYTWASIADSLGLTIREASYIYSRLSQQNIAATVASEQSTEVRAEHAQKDMQKSAQNQTQNTIRTHTEVRAEPHADIAAMPDDPPRVPPATDEEWEKWPLSWKLRAGKPATTPDGRRYLQPLSEFEREAMQREERRRRFDAEHGRSQ